MNKKGFVLAETLVVTIFVLLIFTVLYNSVVPLLGRYDELSYYDDLDTTYDVYQYRKILESDRNYSSITSNNYKLLTCNDFTDNILKCDDIDDLINFNDDDSLLYINTSYLDELERDTQIDSDIRDYLRYLKIEDDKKILLLKHDDYISYIDLSTSTIKTSETVKEIAKKENSTCRTYIEEDGITYISGSKYCIKFNYVWYSGKMWRIVAIYNDGSMKLVTENNITTISYNYDSGERWFYKEEVDPETGEVVVSKSYMYQWLNEDFLDTLVDYDEIIDTTKYWNATMTNSGIDVIKPAEYDENGRLLSTMIPSSIAKVGLLNGYEYSKSYQENVYSIGYLNIGYYFWLLNPTGELSAYGTGSIGEVTNQGYYSGDFPIVVRGVRPSIIVKPGVSFSSGSGLYNDPYIITTTNKATGRENELINSRISGEYIKFKSEGVGDNYDAAPLYRIVGIEDDNKITKIVSMNYATYDNGGKTANTKGYGVASDAGTTYGNGTTNETWDYYLNNTWYNNLSFKDKLISSTYYIGKVGNSGSYKLSICSVATTDTTSECAKTLSNTFNVGLLRYGEMFATQQGNGNSIDMWLITKYSSWSVWIASNSGTGDGNHPPNPCAVRPSYHLKSNVKIISGSGTFDDPYIVD